MIKYAVSVLIVAILAFVGFNCSGKYGKLEMTEPEKEKDIFSGEISALKMDNLMTSQLQAVEGTEGIVSRVEIPPNTTLPKHWHPGEEFAYVLQGSVIVWQKDKPDTYLKKGDVFKVPLEQIHTAKTEEEGVIVLVFRVHEEGQPNRVKVE